MKVLVVGSGGREHTLIRKLKESPLVTELFCAPGNGGISADATCLPVKATDIEGMVACAKENNIDFCVVAPDDPLVLGMVDAMEAEGIKTFGPTAKAAAIEGSKVFSKNLMKKYGIPTAGYEVFDDAAKVMDYIEAQNSFPAVIKADGLALGKGVIIAQNLEEAKAGISSIMEDKIFGKSGDNVVVEEFLTGPEVSVLCFTDGKTFCPMVSSMDHKRVYDNDQGPNTGGMGTIAPNPYYTPEV
ncbi:MAG: phosphoribosylamine--glycine ligase, partial [Oscillospiraceae bacterium]|nr:phosphoribosylamine--glycine ligase [Oscillospiraceae bacterium]